MHVGPVTWETLPAGGAPTARYQHTAVWTGDAMVVWGGNAGSVTATGGVYEPATQAWTATSTTGAPEARHSHTAVWTGSAMLVWGGYGTGGIAAAGGRYDPSTDTWKPISTAGQPQPRQSHSAVWTGSRMIVWGGTLGGMPVGSGGVYDPASDTWSAMPGAGAPSPRFGHVAVWADTRMIVWGGYNLFDWLQNGAIFDASAGAGAWQGATATSGAPSRREGAAGVWTGSRMIVWGGWTGGPYESTGGVLDPAGGWVATASTDAPTARAEHMGVWTGTDLFVWGGCGDDLCSDVRDDGGRFVPDASGGTWTPIGSEAALSSRRGHAGVSTGSSVIVWGGRRGANQLLGDGAIAKL